jgi:hypothetical protein
MFNSLWFIVPIILIVAIVILFTAFIAWLARTLDGYPMSLIQNGDRGPRPVGGLHIGHSLQMEDGRQEAAVMTAARSRSLPVNDHDANRG